MFSRRERKVVRVAVLLVAALALAACESDAEDTAAGSTVTTGSAAPAELPEDPDAIVIQFTTGGGETGPCCDPWRVPDATAYGDGRVVFVEGTVGQVPGMRQATVSRSDLVDLLGHAQEAGVLGPGEPDTGSVCCDMGYTRVILGEGTTTHEFQVMGLGAERDGDDVSDEQERTRQAIAELRTRLLDLAENSDSYSGYTADELAVSVFPGTRSTTVEPTPWPLEGSLAEGGIAIGGDGRCLHITTDSTTSAARAVLAAARQSARTLWSSAGQEWTVFVRPLLPHEHGCPPATTEQAAEEVLVELHRTGGIAGLDERLVVTSTGALRYTSSRPPADQQQILPAPELALLVVVIDAVDFAELPRRCIPMADGFTYELAHRDGHGVVCDHAMDPEVDQLLTELERLIGRFG